MECTVIQVRPYQENFRRYYEDIKRYCERNKLSVQRKDIIVPDDASTSTPQNVEEVKKEDVVKIEEEDKTGKLFPFVTSLFGQRNRSWRASLPCRFLALYFYCRVTRT